MKKGAVVSVLSLLFQCSSAFAQQSVVIRGGFSIGMADSSGYIYNKGYGGIGSSIGDSWTLYLGGANPNMPFALCGSRDYERAGCLENFGKTDQYGNWTSSVGVFDKTTVGTWTEWIKFPDGTISNQITFTVGDTVPNGQLLINNTAAGVFHVDEQWTLSLSQVWSQSFDLCGETNGGTVNCALNFGTVDASGSWTLTGVFPKRAVGGWSAWLRFPDGTITNRIVFTVDDAPLDDLTCENGTLYPIGPNAGFANFQRYMSDWHPTNAGDYAMLADHPGGVGNTLEYLGCKSANYVWLQWAYGGLATIAVRAPWGGRTDRGLRIGDSLARFQSLYPAAHHPVPPPDNPGYYNSPLWPSDLDVWDNGPLRVAFRDGAVAIIQAEWWLIFPNDDQQDSTDLAIGPTDTGIMWP